jgi:hypothetical protein
MFHPLLQLLNFIAITVTHMVVIMKWLVSMYKDDNIGVQMILIVLETLIFNMIKSFCRFLMMMRALMKSLLVWRAHWKK